MRAYKIKTVLFLYAVGFLAATKKLHKRKEKPYQILFFFIYKYKSDYDLEC